MTLRRAVGRRDCIATVVADGSDWLRLGHGLFPFSVDAFLSPAGCGRGVVYLPTRKQIGRSEALPDGAHQLDGEIADVARRILRWKKNKKIINKI